MKAYRVSTFPDGKLPSLEEGGFPYKVVEVDEMSATRVFMTKSRNSKWEHVISATHHWFALEADAKAYAIKLWQTRMAAITAEAEMITNRLTQVQDYGRVIK